MLAVPTPSPTISPLPAPVIEWYAVRGAAASGLDPSLVRAVIDAESGGDPRAVSKAGAIGMMQLASDTASDCGIHNRFDAEQNVECGARTLGYLVRRFGVAEGIAAYNFGSGNVSATGDHLSKMPAETQSYVRDVIDEYDLRQHQPLPPALPPASSGALQTHPDRAWILREFPFVPLASLPACGVLAPLAWERDVAGTGLALPS